MQWLKEWIQLHFHTNDFELQRLDKGISNHNYLLTINGDRYIVRFPKPGHDRLHLQFEKEKIVLPYVSDLDVKTVLFDDKLGIKVTKYVPDVLEFHESKDPKKIEKTANLLKTLHKKEVQVPFSFEPFHKIQHYKEQIQRPIIFFSQEESTIQVLKDIYQPNTLCHNDVVQGNILFDPLREYLIDWEYSAMNDHRFDIASFFSENQIIDPSLRARFYKAYDSQIDDKEIRLFEAMEDILWGYWANLLFEQRNEPIYYQIAKEKEEHYHTFSRK